MKKTLLALTVILAGVLGTNGRAQQPSAATSAVEAHIATFDDLDFNVFTHRNGTS